ncbi:hypothetical protein BDF14DRAFT_1159148 [Spinellus fusiger]|nr:hypothetical protein BDF14DRAFT_1159148 [Spinellus fusiger]
MNFQLIHKIIINTTSWIVFSFNLSDALPRHTLLRTKTNQHNSSNNSKFPSHRSAIEHAGAQAVLGFCYEFGLGVSKDYKMAEHYYLLSLTTDPNGVETDICGVGMLATVRLSYFYMLGKKNVKLCHTKAKTFVHHINKKGKTSLSWLFENAHSFGCSSSQFCLGQCYYFGVGVEKDLKLSAKYYILSAKQNNALSQEALGRCYEYGHGVLKNIKLAMKYYKISAIQHEAVAYRSMAIYYSKNNNANHSDTKAFYFFKKAAELGDTLSQTRLARLYEKGTGITPSTRLAAYWYKKAADMGCKQAQYSLARFLEIGKGLDKNAKLAVYWYLHSAKQGYSDGQYSLGLCYINGIGIAKDTKVGFWWMKRAADSGHKDSHFFLGYHLLCGKEIQQDYTKGMNHLHEAARRGSEQGLYFYDLCRSSGPFAFATDTFFLSREDTLSQNIEMPLFQQEENYTTTDFDTWTSTNGIGHIAPVA